MSIVLVLLLAASVVPLALADEAGDVQQDEVEIDAETQAEVEIMNYQFGAEVRLLQLEKSISKNILCIILVLKKRK